MHSWHEFVWEGLYTGRHMKTLLIGVVTIAAFAFPSMAFAWGNAAGNGPNFPVNLDMSSSVTITATPNVITAGEETYVRWGTFLLSAEEHAQCTTNFTYTPRAGTMTDQGNGYWAIEDPGGYLNDYPTATKTYTVTCPRWYTTQLGQTTHHDTQTVSVTVTVVAASNTDLTASTIAPTSIVSGLPVTFTSTISNVGAEATPTGFTTLFQLAIDTAGTLASDIGTFARTTPLSASSNFTATYQYDNPPLAANSFLYLRSCADKSSGADVGSISESSEANNCSPWTRVDISATTIQCSDGIDNDSDGRIDTADTGDCTGPTDPTEGTEVTATLTANPTAVALGESSTLTWSSTGATSCTGIGFNTNGATSGSTSVSPANTANYIVTCTAPGGSDTASATVTVGAAATADISVAPERVASGSSATVTWSSTGATVCSVAGPGLSSAAVSGSQSVTVTKQQTYTISCGTATDSATVNIIPRFEEF